MIVIHIDSQKDTAFLKKCYDKVEGAIVLYNPTKAEVNKCLEEHPEDDVMMLGHGSSSGLFSVDWKGNVIDYSNANLLKGRNCIGIWCYAKNFARQYGLKGYFTNMFISNAGEARSFGYKATEEEVFNEVAFFAGAVNTLILDSVPYEEWVGKLQGIANMDKDFVNFNYSAMEYFDGTQEPIKSSYVFSEYIPRDFAYDYEDTSDAEVDAYFEDYCYEHDIRGDWAREIAYPIFVAGWNANKMATEM